MVTAYRTTTKNVITFGSKKWVTPSGTAPGDTNFSDATDIETLFVSHDSTMSAVSWHQILYLQFRS